MTCADTVNLTVMQVQLDTEKTLLTLKHNRECNLEIKTIPAIETEFNEYRVDIVTFRLHSTLHLESKPARTFTPRRTPNADRRENARSQSDEFYIK